MALSISPVPFAVVEDTGNILYNEEATGVKNIMETCADTEEKKIAIGN